MAANNKTQMVLNRDSTNIVSNGLLPSLPTHNLHIIWCKNSIRQKIMYLPYSLRPEFDL